MFSASILVLLVVRQTVVPTKDVPEPVNVTIRKKSLQVKLDEESGDDTKLD